MLLLAVSSAGGDDRSISGSSDTSDTSHSDCSVGSRLAIWTEPASNPPENVSHAGAKAALQISDKISANQGGAHRPAAKPPRQLQEIGRQSSSDSGIATGSHSSYTGSFSSYTGSLDTTTGEDFGSFLSLPPHLAQDLSPCTCPAVPGHEYQVPTSLRYVYDTPRSVLQEAGGGVRDNEASALLGLTAEAAQQDKSCGSAPQSHSEAPESPSVSECLQGLPVVNKKTKVAPSSDSCNPCTSPTSVSKTIVTICSVCSGFKVSGNMPVRFVSWHEGVLFKPRLNKRRCVLLSHLLYCQTFRKKPSVPFKWSREHAPLHDSPSRSSSLCAQALSSVHHLFCSSLVSVTFVVLCGLTAMPLCGRCQNNQQSHGPSVEHTRVLHCH